MDESIQETSPKLGMEIILQERGGEKSHTTEDCGNDQSRRISKQGDLYQLREPGLIMQGNHEDHLQREGTPQARNVWHKTKEENVFRANSHEATNQRIQ